MIDFVNMETLELNVAKRAILKTRHVILVRALVLLVDVNVDIQEYPAVQNAVLVSMVTTVMNHVMDVYQTPVIENLVSA